MMTEMMLFMSVMLISFSVVSGFLRVYITYSIGRWIEGGSMRIDMNEMSSVMPKEVVSSPLL